LETGTQEGSFFFFFFLKKKKKKEVVGDEQAGEGAVYVCIYEDPAT
jgi:hypothetical protein